MTAGRVRKFRRRRLVVTLLIVLVGAVVIRLALPHALAAYVNRQLAHLPGYGGHIGRVHVALWRGAYRIDDLEVTKTSGDIAVPFYKAQSLDLSVQWKELFHGTVVSEIEMLRPELHVVSGPTSEETQTGKGVAWGEALESLFPFKINRLHLADGRLHFHNLHSEPPVDIYLNQAEATATNLTNARDLVQKLPAGIQARGATLGEGQWNLGIQLNPMAVSPTFELSAQATNIDLVALNDFLRAYGKFDVERGRFALFASFATAGGSYDGYAKVFFEDLDVFAWEKERKKNALGVFWNAIVGGLSTVFRNHPSDRLAAKIPISGSFENTNVDLWTTVVTLLRNAFVRALVPKLDAPIRVEEIREKS